MDKTHKQHEKTVMHSKPKDSSSVDPKIIGACALVVIIILGVIYLGNNSNSAPLTVQVGDNVSVSYVGTLTNGTVFDSTAKHGNQPLTFTVGSGQLIQGFDQGVIGMSVNETKTITIPANEAYGESNPALIINVPTSQFGNQTIEKGMVVTQSGNGQSHQGVVTAVNGTNVTIDFNSPLAGQTLIFKITVLAIRKK